MTIKLTASDAEISVVSTTKRFSGIPGSTNATNSFNSRNSCRIAGETNLQLCCRGCAHRSPLRPVSVAIDSGCRPSELLALRWQDVDMETGRIAMQRGLTWNRKYGGYTIGPLKIPSSYGCIVLDKTTVQVLTKHRLAQHQERLKLDSDYENQNLVF